MPEKPQSRRSNRPRSFCQVAENQAVVCTATANPIIADSTIVPLTERLMTLTFCNRFADHAKISVQPSP